MNAGRRCIRSPAHPASRTLSTLLLLALVALATGRPSMVGMVRADRPTEYEVKAAFLYNFALFTRWPAAHLGDTTAPLVIGLFAADPFGPHLDRAVARRTVAGHPIQVRRIAQGDPIACHVLFVPETQRTRLPQLLDALRDSPILVVSDEPSSGRRRPMILFRLIGGQVRFELSLPEVEQAGLSVNAQLMGVACRVRTRSNPSGVQRP